MTGWWDYLYPPSRARREAAIRRPCGCDVDIVVFGHQVRHPVWTEAGNGR